MQGMLKPMQDRLAEIQKQTIQRDSWTIQKESLRELKDLQR